MDSPGVRPHSTNWGSREEHADAKHKLGGNWSRHMDSTGCYLFQGALSPPGMQPPEQRVSPDRTCAQWQGWEGALNLSMPGPAQPK